MPSPSRRRRLRKPYEGHEVVYRRMQKRGVRSWGEREEVGDVEQRRPIDPHNERFLGDAIAQAWAPRSGRVIELGCGTAPILRWFAARGYRGVGVDVCPTALAMARAQSRRMGLTFRQMDACSPALATLGSFDWVIDGHCLHCVITPADRAAFVRNARRLLRPGGVLLVMTMCTPADRREFAVTCKGQHLVGGTIYVPASVSREFEGWRRIRGRECMPTRRVEHWTRILVGLRKARFQARLVRLAAPGKGDPLSSLAVAAVAV